jgi:redox-sensing transcriptional repressor
MPSYLRILKDLVATDQKTVSATFLAKMLGFEPIVVRKDFDPLPITGKSGVGYDIHELIKAIEDHLGWNNITDAFLVGTGNLGSALLGYRGFEQYGVKIVLAFDVDPAKTHRTINDVHVLPVDEFPLMAERMKVQIGILAVPAEFAQGIANKMIQAGICGIWNFAPVKLTVPENVVVQNEDLAEGLAVLSVKLDRSKAKAMLAPSEEVPKTPDDAASDISEAL